jgi:hypothetical protein
MASSRASLVVSSLLIVASFATGCGQGDRPPMGSVSGVITIDGDPLSGVIVLFTPENGRPATAMTDIQGRYQLQYVGNVYGCKTGENTVSFTAPTSGSPSHPIPAKYQGKTDLKVEVASGRNNFDFDLESETSSEAKQSSPAGAKKAGTVLD